jgi:hypothetical protein
MEGSIEGIQCILAQITSLTYEVNDRAKRTASDQQRAVLYRVKRELLQAAQAPAFQDKVDVTWQTDQGSYALLFSLHPEGQPARTFHLPLKRRDVELLKDQR